MRESLLRCGGLAAVVSRHSRSFYISCESRRNPFHVFCFSFVILVVLHNDEAASMVLARLPVVFKKKVEEISMHVLCLGHSQLKLHGHDYLE